MTASSMVPKDSDRKLSTFAFAWIASVSLIEYHTDIFVRTARRLFGYLAVCLRGYLVYKVCVESLSSSIATATSSFFIIPDILADVISKSNVSSCLFTCVLMLHYVCPQAVSNVSSWFHKCVLMLHYVCPQAVSNMSSWFHKCVLMLEQICPHASLRMSSCLTTCV